MSSGSGAGRPTARLVRARLGHSPTPLEHCQRLSGALGGVRILVKRDDCTGLAGGGNKVRKLEFILGKAMAEGADSVVTFGAVQSNHARQTAAACARLGLRCELILTRAVPRSDPPYETLGNPMLDRILGARLHVVDGTEEALAVHERVASEVAAGGGKLVTVPAGGSDATGVMGYVEAVWELAEQIPDGEVVDRVVLAASTAGTAAGLVLGLQTVPSPSLAGAAIDAVCVHHDASATAADLKRLVAAGGELIGVPSVPEERCRVRDEWLGPAYGVPTREVVEAALLFARSEGLLLDPVYTAKAAAALVAMVRRGEVSPDETVVFLHTGGWPVLPAYAEELGNC